MSLPQYQLGQAEQYCLDHGWIYRKSGDELVLRECPYCSAKNKFYFNNSKGFFQCKSGSCAKAGNFYQLQKEFGGEEPAKEPDKPVKRKIPTLDDMLRYEIALEEDDDAKQYLLSRGLTMETAKTWHLGVKTEAEIKWLLIPYINGRDIVDIKYRSLPPASKRFKRLSGGDSILFGHHLLAEEREDKVLYLVEGEIDAMTLWQHGLTPVVSTTAGAGTFKSQWYDLIEAYDPTQLVICYDSDVAGQTGAENLLKKFEHRNCVNLQLPDKDANDYFLTHTADDFRQMVADTRPIDVEDVISMASVLDRLERQMFMSADGFDGIPSQFGELNAMTAGGYWNGQLITVSGISGTGKTSFVMQELLTMSTGPLGIASYLLCLEMPVEMMMRKLMEHKFGIPMLKLTQHDVARYREVVSQWRLHLGEMGGTLESVVKKITDAHKRHEIKICAFDNINYFVRSIDHETQEIARAMKTFKELAKELNIPIIMIAQPRKFDSEARSMTGADLKGSGSLLDDSDTVILLHRQRIKTAIKDMGSTQGFIGNMTPYCQARVEKARYSAGGETYLFFDGARSTYRELSESERESRRKAS